MMNEVERSLCFPDEEKSCFACCPPIRPADYEHRQFRNSVKRILVENTADFAKKDSSLSPITGFSCWALGFVDKRTRQVGCLLHPVRNGGRDLRYKVDYGEKCARESCPEAKEFLTLGAHERSFYLYLADGLDSFSYSSRQMNPLFNLLGWGHMLLTKIADYEGRRRIGRDPFFERYPFFRTRLNPRANAYLLSQVMRDHHLPLLRTESFRIGFESLSERLCHRLRSEARKRPQTSFTHLLGLDTDFSDFLRLAGGLSKITREGALVFKGVVDEAAEQFVRRFSRDSV